MKAVMCRQLGGTLAVEEVADPVPAAGEIAIRVEACGVNFADTLIVRGQYQVKPELPFIPGMEVAGRVAAVGPGVEGHGVGDTVIGLVGTGGFAELVVCPAARAIPRPAGVASEVAAAIPVAYGTAHVALEHRAALRPGETLLVHGASGGVGLAAVETGKAMGATVIATASSAEKLAIAREHGADHLVDYARGPFRERVKEIAGGGADVIFDPVGGDVFDQSLRCIAWGGRLLTVGFAAGRIPQAPANILLVKNISVVGIHWSSYRGRADGVLAASFARLFAWLREGRIRPLVSRGYPLHETPAALAALAGRRAQGKIVVLP